MKKKDIGALLTGMALGAALTGGAVAAGITAEPSWSPIFVDGHQVQMTAYNIAGNNFVKLRDIGQAVGFNVYYQDGVQVDSDASYTGEAPAKSDTPQAPAASSIKASSYKGSTLKAGDRSMLLISPSGGTYTAVSSDPAVAAVEQVSGQWVIAAKAGGSVTITVTDSTGETASLALTVETDTSPSASSSAQGGAIDLNANMDIRLKMVEYINQTRRENGLAELPIEGSLMNAAQDVSGQCVTEHRPYDHKALIRYGWSHGGMFNLTMFGADDYPDIAQRAISNWVNSPGHFQTMLLEEASCVGAGVTFDSGRVYCYMVVGDPTAHNPYE